MERSAIDRQAYLHYLSMDLTIGYKLRRAQLAVFQDFTDSFLELKLRPAEFAVMSIVAASPGRKQAAVAENLGIKPANLVALIDGLEQRGLIERRRGESDRRAYLLFLTETGERFVDEMYSVWSRHEQKFIDRLGGEPERDRLIAMLDRLIDPATQSSGK